MYGSTQIRHLVREALMGLARRRISGTVAVLIMGSSLLMLALFSLITINLDSVLQSVRGEVDCEVFLELGLENDRILTLGQELLALHGVQGAYFVSPEMALGEFREELGEDAILLDAVGENPLPPSYRLALDDEVAANAEHMEDLMRVLAEFPGVDEVISQVAMVRQLDRMSRVFMVVSLAVGLLVLISALFVISNTVRLTVEERSRNIEIMKQVGATNWFIRTPFLISGAMQGAAAGALAMGLLILAHRLLESEVPNVYFFAPVQIGGFVVLSTLLGGLGSAAALRRHLSL